MFPPLEQWGGGGKIILSMMECFVSGRCASLLCILSLFITFPLTVLAADLLRKHKAKSICLIATHGILSGSAPEDFQQSCIEQIVVTNTIPQVGAKGHCRDL